MKQFTKGFFFGSLATIGALASGVFAFHKSVIEPIEQEEERFDQNRRQANRKNQSAHQL